MVWVGRALKDHLIPTLQHGQGHLLLDQVTQSPIQPGLEDFQEGGIYFSDFYLLLFSTLNCACY